MVKFADVENTTKTPWKNMMIEMPLKVANTVKLENYQQANRHAGTRTVDA
ncbi:MAG TPA: hypothetical protein VGN20_22110 [Mucilaginibacter sp.]